MQFSNINIPFVSLFEIFLTITVTIFLNSILRSSIRFPKRIDSRRGRTFVVAIRNLISIVLFGIALHIFFIILGINVAPLLASAGILGLAIGIGARPVIEDFISGLFLLSQASIDVGDYVNVGSGIEGVIENIGYRTIVLRGQNGAIIIVPNGQIKQVVNYSQGHANIYVDIPIKIGQDVDAIITLLNKILQQVIEDKNNKLTISSDSYVWGIQNIVIPNCYIVRVVLVTSYQYREEADKVYRYRVIKEFEKRKLQFT